MTQDNSQQENKDHASKNYRNKREEETRGAHTLASASRRSETHSRSHSVFYCHPCEVDLRTQVNLHSHLSSRMHYACTAAYIRGTYDGMEDTLEQTARWMQVAPTPSPTACSSSADAAAFTRWSFDLAGALRAMHAAMTDQQMARFCHALAVGTRMLHDQSVLDAYTSSTEQLVEWAQEAYEADQAATEAAYQLDRDMYDLEEEDDMHDEM